MKLMKSVRNECIAEKKRNRQTWTRERENGWKWRERREEIAKKGSRKMKDRLKMKHWEE